MLAVTGVAEAQDTTRAPGDTMTRIERDSLRAIRDSVREARDSVRTAARCQGQTVTRIDVVADPPDFGRIVERSRFLTRVVSTLHMTTDEDVIRRFVILEVGRPCLELRRAESERILRAQPFLGDAEVRVFPDGEGVRVEVRTVDETSTVAALATEGATPRPSALKLGNANVLGHGMYADVEWREGFFYRDAFGARFRHYQMFGRPYQLVLLGRRRELGSVWEAGLSHPFLTDLQRIAWRVNAGSSDEFFTFLREDGAFPALRQRRDFADIGGIVRIGLPGQLSLFGLSFSQDREEVASEARFITDSGVMVVPDPDPRLLQFREHRATRVNALWGVRNISFLPVVGFDALTGAQDVRIGLQFGTLFGRSLSVLGSEDDDIFVAADVYAGAGSPRAFSALQIRGRGRQDGNSNRWDGVLLGGRFAWYVKPQPKHTIVASAEFGGGWRQRLPFQLTLADPLGGVRGYRQSQAGGAQRLVARLEERWVLGRPRELGDLGLAFFADAGRLWAGDAPYGVNTPIKTGLGMGILAAVPPRSRRVYRLDLAFPLSADPHARWEVRVSTSDLSRLFWNEPDDLTRSRERSLPTNIFQVQ